MFVCLLLFIFTMSKSFYLASADDSIHPKAELAKMFRRTDIGDIRKKLLNAREKWVDRLRIEGEEEREEREGIIRTYQHKPVDHVRVEGDSLREVNARANLGKFLFQGDIVLTAEQADILLDVSELNRRIRRQAYRDRYYPATIWGSTLYYSFDSSATPQIREVFTRATEIWRDNTCIHFQENDTAPDRVNVIRGVGCWSYIGKIEGIQDLSLGAGCETVGTAVHELAHALGFFHTQSRVDRDCYITLFPENINPEDVDQFELFSADLNFNYGLQYDYGSVMHYGDMAGSFTNQPTMIAKDQNYQETMGSDIIAFIDISMMNDHYQCNGRCPGVIPYCSNGGFLNTTSCNSCICPSGYAGDLCDERPSGCGSELVATEKWQLLNDTLGDGLRTIKLDFIKCNYWITAGKGCSIEVRLKSISGFVGDGCVFGGVEIKTNPDIQLTGYRFCSLLDAGKSFFSLHNIVPIITFNRFYQSNVQIEYRISK